MYYVIRILYKLYKFCTATFTFPLFYSNTNDMTTEKNRKKTAEEMKFVIK